MKKVAIAIAAVVGVVVLSLAGTVFGNGADLIDKTTDADNVIFTYEHFFNLNAVIEAYPAQINNARQAAEASSDQSAKDRYIAVVLGLQNKCNEDVRQYNADAQKFNRALFLDNDLPNVIGTEYCA